MEWPLTIAALVFFAAYALEILAGLTGSYELLAEAIIWVAWGVFVVDYFARFTITENRWKWFTHHLLDLAIVVLPMLRPLRLMRFLTFIAIIQRGAGGLIRGRVVLFTIGSTILVHPHRGTRDLSTPNTRSATSSPSATRCGGRS